MAKIGATLSIRSKIICLAAAVILFSIGASTLVSTYVFKNSYKDALQSRAFAIGKSLKLQLDRLLQLGIQLDDIVGFEEQCQDIVKQYEGIEHAEVFDLNGKVLFSNDPLQQGKMTTSAAAIEALQSGREVLGYSRQNADYEVIIPVFSGQSQIAAVSIGFPSELINRKSTAIAVYSIGAGVCSLIIASIFLYLALSSLVTIPLTQLITAIRDIQKKGILDKRVHVSSHDEIGQLAATFNQMTVSLQETKVMAETANRAKSDFLANMHHELRTPLNAVIGFSEMMLSGLTGELTDQQKEFLQDIHDGGKRLFLMLNDMLDVAQMDANATKLELAEFILKDVIEGAVLGFRDKALKRNINLTMSIQDGSMTILADAAKIRHVIFNLLNNAFKFTPEGGSVRIAARGVQSSQFKVQGYEGKGIQEGTVNMEQGDDLVEISVEDTGIGISEEDQNRLFQPFQQIEAVLTKKASGTGLGLYLCKRIIDLHKGTILAKSEPGKGSILTFVIPAKQLNR